ncbi:MAG: hypothetical protein IKR09_05005 [Alphaproteobacteria bacterium]|nr:hypothetical protein [Alphaproteobacteria bacterium]
MDSSQQTATQPVKKILVKRVKVLVKRPVPAAPGATAAPKRPTLIKVPVKKVVPASPAASAAVSHSPAPAETTPPAAVRPPSESGRPSYVGQVIHGVEVKPVVFELPNDILAAVERYKKIPQKALALYIYARVYAERVAKEHGRQFPPMLVELPEDTMQMKEIIHDAEGDELFDAILDDFLEMTQFIEGLDRIVNTKAPLEEIIRTELNRQRNSAPSTAGQIVLAYLNLLIDMLMVHEKLTLMNIDSEIKQNVDKIKEMEEDEKAIKRKFVTAIERKRFPVNARKLIDNYFNLAKRDPDKAYETLTTNPLFFSPILLEKMPKKFFGLIKPSPKDALAVNKQLASFLKNLKA